MAHESAHKSAITQIPNKFNELPDRKISRATAEKYQVWRDNDKTYFPYFNDGKQLDNKLRTEDKRFWFESGGTNVELFGQHLFQSGQKFITLVEGEYDAMAAYELMGSRWPVVSVIHGAEGAAKDVANNFEYLNSFENIVICFDKDEAKVNERTGQIRYPGQEAAVTCAGMFPIGKVRVCTLREAKDANDYLKANLRTEFNREWWGSKPFTPTGLKFGRDMREEVSKPKKYETVPYPWNGLNDLTYGIRLSEFVLITAEPKVGKTSILKEIIYHLRKNRPDTAVGLLLLEEPNQDSAIGLMSLEAQMPLHLPDIRETVSDEDFMKYFDAVIDTDKLVFYDHFGSNGIQEILNKIRHMAALGCKYIILDHLSIIVSDQSGDERRQLDEISTKIKTLTIELNIAVIAVIHLNRQGNIRSSAGPEQLANIVIKLHRERLSEDAWRRNVTKVVVEMNRFCGRSGPATYLFFNENTSRLIELDDEEVKIYNSGGTEGFKDVW